MAKEDGDKGNGGASEGERARARARVYVCTSEMVKKNRSKTNLL